MVLQGLIKCKGEHDVKVHFPALNSPERDNQLSRCDSGRGVRYEDILMADLCVVCTVALGTWIFLTFQACNQILYVTTITGNLQR